jgi:8-oxo-dGTP pyrophosphatase MutT (NUDIX family)
MSETNAIVPGLERAIAEYGAPVARTVQYDVTYDTFLYWELVRRKRTAEVVLLLRRPNGRYVVHTKAFYPQGTYRLLSGGVKPGEALVPAVRREALEETGLEVRIERFLGQIEHQFRHKGRCLPFTSYLFVVSDDGGEIASNDPGEEITDYREVALEELLTVADELESLPEDWIDWGRFRAVPHRLAVELLSQDDD